MRIINLAQTAFYLIGAYVGLTLLTHHFNFWLSGLAGGVTTALLGFALYSLFLHRYHADHLTSLLLTLGSTLMIDDSVLAIWGGDPHSISPPPELASSLQFGRLVFPSYWLALIVVSFAIAALLFVFMQRTKLGMIIRAAVDDEEMTRGLGVDVNRSFYIVFTAGALRGSRWIARWSDHGRISGTRRGADAACVCRRDRGWDGQSFRARSPAAC